MGERTDKQRLFVAEYLKDLNATRAAIRAGYPKRTACSRGQRLLKDVEVAVAIEAAMERRIERTERSTRRSERDRRHHPIPPSA